MSEYNIKDFRFTTLDTFIKNFTPPTNAIHYDHKNERAAVINKYNFTQEDIAINFDSLEELTKKREKELYSISNEMQDLNSKLLKSKNDISTLDAINKANEMNVRLKKMFNAHQKHLDKFPTPKVKPLLINSLDKKSREFILDKFHINPSINIPSKNLELIKKDFDKGSLSKEEYEKKYNALALEHSKLEVDNDFFYKYIEGVYKHFVSKIVFMEEKDLIKYASKKEHQQSFIDAKQLVMDNSLDGTLIKEKGKLPEYRVGVIPEIATGKEIKDYGRLIDVKKGLGDTGIMLEIMLNLNPEKYHLIDNETKEKYKNLYGNDGSNKFYHKTHNGITYIAKDDILKIAKEAEKKDVLALNDYMKLFQFGIDALESNDRFEDMYKDAAKNFDLFLWNEKKIDKKQKDYGEQLLDKIKDNSQAKDYYKKFAGKSKKYMQKVAQQIYNQYPSEISDLINIVDIVDASERLIEIELEELSSNWINYLDQGKHILSNFKKNGKDGFLDFGFEKKSPIQNKDFLRKRLDKDFYNYMVDSEGINTIGSNIMLSIRGRFLQHYVIDDVNSIVNRFEDHSQAKSYMVVRNKIMMKMMEIYDNKLHLDKRPTTPKMIMQKLFKEDVLKYNGIYKIGDIINFENPNYSKKYKRLEPKKDLENVKNDSKTIERLFIGASLSEDKKSPYLSDMIDLEKQRNGIITTHNNLLNEYKIYKEKKDSLSKNFNSIVAKLKEFKIENHVITNNVDNDKFLKTMQTMVDMIQVGENKDKIIDLTDTDNFDEVTSSLENMLGDELDLVTKNTLILNYIADMNALYEDRGLTEEHSDMRLDLIQRAIYASEKETIFSERGLTDWFVQFDKVEPDPRYTDKNGLKVYEGKHFPLFIDKETLSIWSLEWTSKHPTLTITTIPPLMLDSHKNGKLEKFGIKNEKLTPEKMRDDKYKIQIVDAFMDWVGDAHKDMSREKGENVTHAQTIERMREIFSLIQSNYFIQLGQPEDRALFLDVDPNYLEKTKKNIGAISFMSMEDQELVFKFKEYANYGKEHHANLTFLDPLNYDKQNVNKLVEANFRKIYGLNTENATKIKIGALMFDIKRIIKEEEPEKFEEILKNAIKYVYGEKGLVEDSLPKNIQEHLDAKLEDLKLFADFKELENYRKDFESTMDKEFEETNNDFVFNSTLIKDNVTINEEIPFNENDLVQHNTFGLGKVIHVIEDGDYYRLTINFDGAQKDILSSFVNKV